MTWLRHVLSDIADDSPQADLAEQTIRTYQRRRRTTLTLTAAATAVVVAVTVLGVTAGVRLLPAPPQNASNPTTIPDLPARGVGPLSHAYKTFCSPTGGTNLPDCRDGGWRVVTRDGKTYHVPEALRSFNRYSGSLDDLERSGLIDSPLAISQDGRIIAYYDAKDGTFKTRNLATGSELAAPVKIPADKLGSISHLLLSDDGRFLVFTKNPAFKDPAMLIDMRERMIRPLPNGWNPIGLSKDGGTVMLAQYSPKPRLQMLSRLWTRATAGNGTSVNLPQAYHFGPLAPDGRTVVALEDRRTWGSKPKACAPGSLVHLDAKTGKVLRKVTVSGLPMNTHNISLRTWLNPAEITAIAEPNPLCTGKRPPSTKDDQSDPAQRADPPYKTITAYAVNINTGKARRLGTYTAQGFFELVLPGPTGAL